MADLKRAWLAHYGAPLLGERLVANRVAPALEKVVVEALGLSRRDASVTRALPVLLWLRRADLDMTKLRRLAAARGRDRTLGFFLDLAARMSGDRRLRDAAAALRRVRPRTLTRFFTTPESALARAVATERAPPVARAWGYRMNMPMDSFQSLFEKVRAMHRGRATGALTSAA